jgi:16S rRNA (uracil1498-N3)-methyltransferase
MTRLVVPRAIVVGDRACLRGALHHHLAHVLRVRAGDALELVDEGGGLHRGVVAELGAGELRVALDEHLPPEPAPRPRLLLVYGISRRARTEWVLQKATEVGVDAILLARCRRSVARAGDERLERWQEIARQAARQSGRRALPQLLPPVALEAALAGASEASLRLVCVAGAPPLSQRLRELAAVPDALAIVVGPEGGLDDDELRAARASYGFEPVGLGPTVLRTETAAVVALALCAALAGRWTAAPPANLPFNRAKL